MHSTAPGMQPPQDQIEAALRATSMTDPHRRQGMTEREAAEYEIAGSLLTNMSGWVLLPGWVSTLAAHWFSFKVRRKYARYVRFIDARASTVTPTKGPTP